MDYIGDFFTVTEPDAPSLHCWRLINVVPRLQEIAAYLEAILYPLENGLANWDNLTDEQKTTIFEFILNADWSGLQNYLELLFPTEPPSNIEALIQNYLYGYYNLAVAKSSSLAIEIVAEEYGSLEPGMKIQYKTSRTATEASIRTLEDFYYLQRWEHRVFQTGELAYEIWGEFWYTNYNETVQTWQYARATAEAFRDSKFGAVMTVEYNTYGGDNDTYYIISYEDTYWAQIGARREVFLPVPTHYYTHYVDPALIHTTDPDTRGGIYSNYNTAGWEYTTQHPETMGNPWAGDAGERPYDDDLYNWINQTVNPPGYTDLIHEFLLTSQCLHIISGYGKDPAAEPRPFVPGPKIQPPGLRAPLDTLSPLAAIFRRRRVCKS
jgi:hypothetical protein